jgi:putative colanic acid biosynthesis glycosyltransferase
MKIVQINSVSGKGSTGRITEDISKMSWENGIENHIFYGVGNSDYEYSIKVGDEWNVKSHIIKTRLLGKHAFYSKNATLLLVEKLTEKRPDIVHLHNIHGHYLNVEILFNYLSKANLPVVWTLHDCWAFTGHCAHFDFCGCMKWQTGCHCCPQLLSYPISFIFDRSREAFRHKKRLFTALRNLTIVTPSQWLADLVCKSFLAPYSIKVINNGIDLSLFKPTKSNSIRLKYNLSDKFVVLGVAAGFGERKGLKYFIELAKTMGDQIQVILVGANDWDIARIPNNIIAVKRTDSIAELAEYYSSADVFINPTLEDNFPTVNIEALACGTPVITFETGGSPEAIDEKTGIVIKRGDSESLRRSILTIIESLMLKNSIECVDRAKSKYNKRVKHLEYIDIYKSLNKFK